MNLRSAGLVLVSPCLGLFLVSTHIGLGLGGLRYNTSFSRYCFECVHIWKVPGNTCSPWLTLVECCYLPMPERRKGKAADENCKLVCIVIAMCLQAVSYSHRSNVKVYWPSIFLLFHVSHTVMGVQKILYPHWLPES